MTKSFISFVLLLCSVSNVISQQWYSGVSAELSGSLLSFRGDLNSRQQLSALNNFRGGYGLAVEKEFSSLIGASVFFTRGVAAQNENSSQLSYYFKTNVTTVGVGATLYFNNKQLLGEESLLTPFVKLGVGALFFKPFGDLQDANGNEYHLWDDGTLRDVSQSDKNTDVSSVLTRDYSYESELSDPTANYNTTTLAVPFSFGIHVQVTENIASKVSMGYVFTGTDYLDNYSTDNKKDKLLTTSLSVSYQITTKDRSKYKDVDFTNLFNGDHDNDGVNDELDECQGTPADVPVDKKGCPLDTDYDGVPDYLDKELNTAKGAHVNEQGETLTDDHFYEQYLKRDSTYTKMVQSFHDAPGAETLKKLDEKIRQKNASGNTLKELPEHCKFADKNNDNIIQSTEALGALDDFLEGDIDVPISTLFELIDYFFEQ